MSETKRKYGKRQQFVSYCLNNINRETGVRTVYARLQLSSERKKINTNFPLEIGTYAGKLSNKQMYLDLAATLMAEAEKMPN